MSTYELKVDRHLYQHKGEVLAYYRTKADESLSQITKTFGSQQYDRQVTAINESVKEPDRDR